MKGVETPGEGPRLASTAVAFRLEGKATPMTPFTPRLRGTSVLLLDDDVDDLAMLGALLRQAGADVTPVTTVEDALRALQVRVPHVVVSDLVMRGHDGFTLVRRLRRMPPGEGGDVPALAISAFADDEQREQALAEGFTDYMRKPVHGQIVEAVMRLAGQPTGA